MAQVVIPPLVAKRGATRLCFGLHLHLHVYPVLGLCMRLLKARLALMVRAWLLASYGRLKSSFVLYHPAFVWCILGDLKGLCLLIFVKRPGFD